MPQLISIPISYFEIISEYTVPNVQLWMDRAAVVQAIFNALEPWNVAVDNVEILTSGKPSEQGVKFKLPEKRSSFFFGPASCRFTRDDVDWTLAEETIQILNAAFNALVSNSGIAIASQITAIALHIQPKTARFIDILRGLVSAPLAALEEEPVTTMATIVKWGKRRITIDGSGQIANGIFLKFEREFGRSTSYGEIAAQLRADEDALFRMLGVKEE